MFCILVFLIFLILFPIFGIFSKDYRILFRKAWSCAFKKVTLKPCDVSFGEEFKNKMLSKIAFRFPTLAKFLDRTASLWAILFVVLSIWSTVYVFNAGLNLWVYDTCDPSSGESCALGGEACGISTTPTIFETISRIPDRLKNWQAEEFTQENSTYYSQFDQSKKTAIEIIDPGCMYCKKLWQNIKEAGFENNYNLTYIAYPIPENGSYKFKYSYKIVAYLESMKLVEASHTTFKIPADWALLDKIFTEKVGNSDLQNQINLIYTEAEVLNMINTFLVDYGYSESEIAEINNLVNSEEVRTAMGNNTKIVEEVIKTVKIPTIIFDGRRYDRVVDVETLKN